METTEPAFLAVRCQDEWQIFPYGDHAKQYAEAHGFEVVPLYTHEQLTLVGYAWLGPYGLTLVHAQCAEDEGVIRLYTDAPEAKELFEAIGSSKLTP